MDQIIFTMSHPTSTNRWVHFWYITCCIWGLPRVSICLFLAYINALPDSVKSKVRLFADDTIMYLTVKSTTYANILQNDLHALEQWEHDWSMEFNSDKCEVLRITRKRNPVIFPYKLHKKELNVTNAAKYLGVTISKDLNWTPHINNITGKAKNTLRFVKRNIKTSNKKVKEMAYNTYVRPQLEYCTTIWSPWQKTLSQKLKVFNSQQHVMYATTTTTQAVWHVCWNH